MQATLERALEEITGERTHVVGSGRTDAGTHALEQVVAFDTTSDLSAAVLQRALNAVLPRDIAITAAAEKSEDFHPRFDARSRAYSYLIWNREIRSPFWLGRAAHVKYRVDERSMDAALQTLIGEGDFSSFVPSNWVGDRTRTIYRAGCTRTGNLITVEIEASGFMRQMVRSIVGTLIEVGSGRLTVDDFTRIVDSRDRTLAGRTAPAGGLYLVRVQYGDQLESSVPPIGTMSCERGQFDNFEEKV